jgi:branched-chain amino acid transport system ATP-binding protein
MGREDSDRQVSLLKRLKGKLTMILVEHDMAAVFALADRISVLIRGRLLTTGLPEQVRADPAVITAYLGEQME